MNFELLQTIVRYGAMIFAGWLVKTGWADESMQEAIVGLIVAIGALAWFLLSKHLPERKARKIVDDFRGENV